MAEFSWFVAGTEVAEHPGEMFGWSLPVLAFATLLPPSQRIDTALAETRAPISHRLLDPLLVARLGRELASNARGPRQRLIDTPSDSDVEASVAASSAAVGYAMPPLLRYARDAGDVSLSLSPGSPCTAACVKLQGSF
jgi:hypothetical protein